MKKKPKRIKTRSGKQQVSGIIQMDEWRMQSFYGPCTSDTLLFSIHIRRHVQSSIFSWNPYLSSLNSFRRHLISRCISSHMAKKVQNEELFFLLFKGHGTPLQYSCLENPMDGGAWWLQSMGLQRVGHDWATSLHFHSLFKEAFFFFFSPLLASGVTWVSKLHILVNHIL